MNVFLANNSGLGDYILMNGATRYVAAQPDVEHVDLLCLGDHNKFRNISWMYRDNPNITVHPEPAANSMKQAGKKIRKRGKAFPHSDKRVFFWGSPVWWEMMPRFGLDTANNCWPELFYAAHQAPFCARHEHFFIKRDFEREERLFNSLNLPNDYAFCSDQCSYEDFKLSIKTKIPVFKPSSLKDYFFGDDYIYDWMTVIERAKEVHTVDTSWLHLIKAMRLDKPKYYYHVRFGPYMQNIFTSPYINDDYDNGWKILDKNGNVIENPF